MLSGSMNGHGRSVKRRWRDYVTAAGNRPVKKFFDALSDEDYAAVRAAMKEVQEHGNVAARHLRRAIYEVRAEGVDLSYRVLFASEGKKSRILLSLHAFEKKTQKTPPDEIALAEDRLKDWRTRAKKKKTGGGRGEQAP
jgi:phage-related protein